MRYWWMILFVAVVGCGPAIPPLPAQGGPPWLELTSDHFTVWTDAPVDRARELVSEMEHLRQIIVGTSFRSVAREARIIVIALRDLAEFHAYHSDKIAGVAYPAQYNVLHEPMIVLPAQLWSRASEQDERLEAHELTHAISFGMIANQPRWFMEGLAEFFGTIYVDDRSGKADLGRPPELNGKPLRMHRLTSIRRLFSCKDCIDEAFYATAWAAFTYLQNVHPEELSHFEQLLAANDSDDWQSAWSQAFPRLPAEMLQDELGPWLVSGKHVVLHFNVKWHDYSITQRVLGEGDIHAVRALLAPAAAELGEIEAALRIDPTNVIANTLLVVNHDRSIAPEAAKATAAAHPDDWRAWRLVASALRTGEEAEAARNKACELAAANPAVVPPKELCAQPRHGKQGRGEAAGADAATGPPVRR